MSYDVYITLCNNSHLVYPNIQDKIVQLNNLFTTFCSANIFDRKFQTLLHRLNTIKPVAFPINFNTSLITANISTTVSGMTGKGCDSYTA